MQRGKAAPGAGLEGAPRASKRSTKLLFYGIKLVCFSEKLLFIAKHNDVFGTLSLSPSHGDEYTSSYYYSLIFPVTIAPFQQSKQDLLLSKSNFIYR